MVLTYAVEGSGPIRYSLPVGAQIALHASATGKAALAALSDSQVELILSRTGMKKWTPRTGTELDQIKSDIEKVRACGYAINWEELTMGVGSVASAILGQNNELLAVLSIGFATSQVVRGDMPKLGERVLDKARKISKRLSNIEGTP
jgi:IclR family acetate operon transcriptional repressor